MDNGSSGIIFTARTSYILFTLLTFMYLFSTSMINLKSIKERETRLGQETQDSIKSAQWSKLTNNTHVSFTLACYIRRHMGRSIWHSRKFNEISKVLHWVAMYMTELLGNNQIICGICQYETTTIDNSIRPPRQCQVCFMLEDPLGLDELIWR